MRHPLRRIFLLCLLSSVWNTVPAAEPGKNSLADGIAALERDDPATAQQIVRPLAESGNADAQHVLGFLCDLGLGVPFDPVAGTAWQERAAESGHYWASLYLAWKCRMEFGMDAPDAARAESLDRVRHARAAPGRVVPADWLDSSGAGFSPNFTRAAHWLRTQVKAGHGQAATTLAQYAAYGFGGHADLNQHLDWLSVAAKLGDGPALERLYLYHENGRLGLAPDPELALDYLRRAASAGLVSAQYTLGRNYARGDGVAADSATAADWFRRAAKQDHVAAINQLADMLRKGISSSAPDYREALQLSRQAAALGDAEAMADVATMLRSGRGADVDLAAAFRLYRESGDKGYAFGAHMAGWMITYGEAGERDYAEARRWFDRAAAKGSSQAMDEIGLQYAEGRGLAADQAEAFLWFERAAREGDVWAQIRVGRMLAEGTGIEQDAEEAAHWFRLAAKQGSAEALGQSADLLRRGAPGLPRNLPEAFRLFRESAEKGYAYGAHMAGWMITYGEAGEPDYVEARRWFDRAAKGGYVAALTQIGLQYSEGRGTAVDQSAAFGWFQQAAEQGDSWAQNRAGWMMLNGQGLAKNPAGAVRWFKRAIEQKNPDAMVNLARLLHRGDNNVPQDLAEALRILRLAAEAGEVSAQYILGMTLLRGDGVEADPTAAVVWFGRAADKKHVPALISLGRCYETGKGVEKDLSRAVECYRKVIAAGHPHGAAFLAHVSMRLPADQQEAVFREVTPLILAREPKAEAWELSYFAGVLFHHKNPLGDPVLGRLLLDRSKESRPRRPPPRKLPVSLDSVPALQP